MVYNVSDPANAKFVEYFNDRNYSELDFQEDFIKDTLRTDSEIASILKNTVASGPESITFIPQGASPLAEPLAVVSNEVTGTVTINQINFKSKAAPLFFSEYAEGSSNNKYLEIYKSSKDLGDKEKIKKTINSIYSLIELNANPPRLVRGLPPTHPPGQ